MRPLYATTRALKEKVHKDTGMQFGNVTFKLDKTKDRIKLIGTSPCGFRGFAYAVEGRMEDAKRAIVNDYREYKNKEYYAN